MNTKFVLGLNRAKQLGLEHWKKPKRVWSPTADVDKGKGWRQGQQMWITNSLVWIILTSAKLDKGGGYDAYPQDVIPLS